MHRFHVKTIETTQKYKGDQIIMNWLIWRQNDQQCWVTSQTIQNNAELQKKSNYNELYRFHVKNIKRTQKYKRDQIRMNLHRFDVKTIKMLSYVANHSKQCRTTKVIKLQSIVSISCQKHQKNAKLQTRSNKDEFASICRQNYQ